MKKIRAGRGGDPYTDMGTDMSNIRVIQGDCFAIMDGMAAGTVDCIITDPPYGILKHHIETGVDITRFMSECHRLLKNRGFLAFFGRQPTLSHWNSEALKFLHFKHEIIWYKRQRSSPMGDLGRVHENISIFCKGKRELNTTRLPYTDLKESLADIIGGEGLRRLIGHLTTPYKNRYQYEEALRFLDRVDTGGDMTEFYTAKEATRNEFVTCGPGGRRKPSTMSAIEAAVLGLKPQSIVSFMPHNKVGFDASGHGEGEFNLKHPTVKPVPLLSWLVELLSNKGDLVLDPFLGTGTTAVACKNQKRNFIGIEIDSHYHEIATERLADKLKKTKGQTELFDSGVI